MMIDESKIKRIVKQTSEETVNKTLSGLGFKIDAPHEIQADLIYLNKIRRGSEFMSLRAKASAIAVLIPTVLYLIWEAIKSSFQK